MAVDESGRAYRHPLYEVMERVPQILVNGTLPERRPLAKMPLTTAAIRDAERTLGNHGRVLVRWSGTEAKLRVMVEGPSQSQIEKLAKGILGVATGELAE